MYYGLILLILSTGVLASPKLTTLYEWSYIDYLWDSSGQKYEFMKNGDYAPEAQIPIDVDKAPDGRVFVTIIRSEGVPATLNTISKMRGPYGPLLTPYPNWSWHRKGDCNGMTSVYRVAIDECNRLWVLDNGHYGDKMICPAQLLVFDLHSDKLIRRVKIHHDVSSNSEGKGLLVTPVIETEGKNCEKTTVFMADVNGFGLVIWDGEKSFRLEAPVFNPVPPYTNYTVAGEDFYFNDGLLGMALSPKTNDGIPRRLIFRPMSSLAMYMAQTRVLAESMYGETVKYFGNDNVIPSQAAAQGVSSEGTLFFGLTKEIALGCWNIYNPLQRSYVEFATVDKDRLQFISGLKVLPPSITHGDEEVWVLSNRLQKIMSGTQNLREINFRIMKGKVSDLIAGTACGSPTKKLYHAIDQTNGDHHLHNHHYHHNHNNKQNHNNNYNHHQHNGGIIFGNRK